MVAAQCGFFLVFGHDSTRGYEKGDSAVLWITVNAFDFLPEGSGICVMIQFSLKGYFVYGRFVGELGVLF